MYGYLFAIIGSLLLVGVIALVVASGAFRSSKTSREDIERGTTRAEPVEEEPDLQRVAEVEAQSPTPSQFKKNDNQS